MEPLQEYFLIILELFGIACSLGYVLCNMRQHMATWYFGLASSVLYAFIFLWGKLYASALLSAVSCGSMVYGWYKWKKSIVLGSAQQPVTLFTWQQRGVVIILGALASWAIYLLLIRFEGAFLLWGDATIAGASLVGFFCAAHKKLETWIVWAGVNTLAVSIYTLSGLYPTAVLYSIFLYLSFCGLREWKKELVPLSANAQAPRTML